MDSCAGVPCYVCEDKGWQAPAEAAESVLTFKRRAWEHGMVLQEPRAEIIEKSKVRTEKGVTENQSSFSGHSTPRMRQCQGLGTVCVRARVEHVRDWNAVRTVAAKWLWK